MGRAERGWREGSLTGLHQNLADQRFAAAHVFDVARCDAGERCGVSRVHRLDYVHTVLREAQDVAAFPPRIALRKERRDSAVIESAVSV